MKLSTVLAVAALAIVIVGVSGQTLKKTEGTLSVRIVLPQIETCVGAERVSIEAVLTNSGDNPVVVSPDGLMYGVNYSKNDGQGANLRHESRELEPARWISIGAHQSVILPFTEPTSDSFFKEAGFYKIQIRFGVFQQKGTNFRMIEALPSNSLFWKLTTCRQP